MMNRLIRPRTIACAILALSVSLVHATAQTTEQGVARENTARNPTPADRAKGTDGTPTLRWQAGRTVQVRDGHMVFVGTRRQDVKDAFYRNHPNVKVYVESKATLMLPALSANTTYYWRVDQINEAVAPGTWKGKVWSFTTGQARDAKGFRDSFTVDHDYLSRGTTGTSWDGFVGKGPRETADRIATRDGKLFLQSTNGRYQEGWNPLGPLLYKTANGDFKATVRVVDYQKLSFNNCGIMARSANLDDAGKGEDWISIDYFPIYGGIYARMADNNRRSEKGSNGQGGNADRYLQLELIGNLFFLRHSKDGIAWKELPQSPITRNDLVNVPLQVGLFHATYSGTQGEVSFDDFAVVLGDPVKTARLHSPDDTAIDRPTTLSLSWIPGGGARHHDVYFGSSRQLVQAASSESNNGVYKGRQEFADIDYDCDGLEDGRTYFWRVDEVGETEVHPGPVWSFTVFDRNLANLESYGTTAAMAADWQASGTATVRLSEQGPHSGQRALQLDYNNADAPHHAMASHTFAEVQDWLSSAYSFRSLRVHFKGSPNNRAAKLYMVFEDKDWGMSRAVVAFAGDPESVQQPTWTRWDIDLQRLVEDNPAFRLNHVSKMSVCIGHPDANSGSGSGSVHFDDISIQYEHDAGGAQSWPKRVRPDRFVQEVPFANVRVTGGLWRERMDVNRLVSLPHVWSRCRQSKKANGQDSKRLDNFRKAANEMPGPFTGIYFNDSDVYKIIEGTANSLQNHPDAELEASTDKLIDSIAAAQWEDGYLYTFYSIPERRPSKRWTNVGSMHELYCAGHLFEAAVAYHEATGKRKLLDVAIKFADLICATFTAGKLVAAPGHQEIELALMKLHRVTGNERYVETAKYFVDQRGNDKDRGLYGTYSQDHIPFVQQEKGVGHSVRAGYLYCAATDIATVLRDEAYANTLFRLWDNITGTKTYITGGVGQPGGPEGFAGDYELGNGCYAETCSGIAFAMWNHRLHQMTGESKYCDLVERTFLNNMLSSLSVGGDKHYYTNPLTTGGRDRWQWPGHDCACCPSNLVRVISSISGYTYSHNADTICVNQYLQSEGTVPLPNNSVILAQATRYPWDGSIAIEVRPEAPGPFRIKLRIPGWARNQPMPGNLYKYLTRRTDEITLSVNGTPVATDIENGYVGIQRHWQTGDTIRLHLPMPIRRVIAHPKAVADKGLVTIERGPIVYCAEFKDNAFDVSQLHLPDGAKLEATFDKDLFNGAVTITSANSPALKLIPYYLYANRGKGWMRIWIPRDKRGS
jgi:DUF1680 family protein